jgi:leucyl aminopeptidase
MEDMKCDMAGAAAVISTAQALLALRNDLDLKHEVHIIAPITENMINGRATKPGDVLRTISGRTIEVLNTDAEGRLILADALAYAEKKIKSDVIIDLATLTGACIVAIGDRFSGIFSDSEEQIKKLMRAGSIAGEKLWQLPLAAEYRPQMDSDVADIKNIGNGGPGATIGALFLKDFVPKNTEWVHIDIAGPAFVTYSGDYHKKGATGVGVRTLLEYLFN